MSESLQTYQSPQDVYARHLVSHRGYPLWTPEPESHLPDDYQNDGLRIGDVGLVVPEEGSFDVLFNICLPPDHPLHEDYGVPDNFETITLREKDISKTRDAENPGCVISSSSVTQMEVNPIEVRSDYRFRLSSSEGALLILPQGAHRHTLRNHRRFGEYASKHALEWYKFAREIAGRSLANDSLYLITGFHKARSWSLASFQEAAGTGDFAQFKVTRVEGESITGAYSWSTTRALEKRVGPGRYIGKENQSVYIKGFKIAITDEPLGKKRVEVTAKIPSVQAQHEEFTNVIEASEEDDEASASTQVSQAGSMGRQHGTLRRVSIQHIPQVSQPFHPSDCINRYLFAKVTITSMPLRVLAEKYQERSATVAITHDSQWTTLLKNGLLEPKALTEGERLEKLLSETYDVVLQDGVVCFQEKAGITHKEPTIPKHSITEYTPVPSAFFGHSLDDLAASGEYDQFEHLSDSSSLLDVELPPGLNRDSALTHDFESLHFESQSPPQLFNPDGSPSIHPRYPQKTPLINAPDGEDGCVTIGLQLHVVPESHLSGSGAASHPVPSQSVTETSGIGSAQGDPQKHTTSAHCDHPQTEGLQSQEIPQSHEQGAYPYQHTPSTSAFTRYSDSSTSIRDNDSSASWRDSDSSAWSMSTTATSVSSGSWKARSNPRVQSGGTGDKNHRKQQALPKNVKIMSGVPWELAELPRQHHPNPVGEPFGQPPSHKPRTRRPRDPKLDTISERPAAPQKQSDHQRHEITKSTADLNEGKDGKEGGDTGSDDVPKKVQKGQINALAKMLSALRR